MAAKDDRLLRAFARLKSLRANLPENRYLDEAYVDQYHESLKHLEALGFDVEEFKIPSNLLIRFPVAGNALTGQTVYSKKRDVERAILLSKLDAVLSYFEMATAVEPPQKRRIGFRPPSEED